MESLSTIPWDRTRACTPTRGTWATPCFGASSAILPKDGTLSLSIPGSGRHAVSLADMAGRRVRMESVLGPGKVEIPGLRRGLYLVTVRGAGTSRAHRIMAY